MATHYAYGLFLKSLALGKINVETHVLKGMICGEGYIPNQNAHEFKSSIDHEVTGSGYAPGGQVITGVLATYTGSSKTLNISAGTLLWPTVTFDAKYIVVYDDSWPDQTNKPLIMYVDFGAVMSPANQSFYYQWPNNTMLNLVLP